LDHIATMKHAVEVDIGISIVPLNSIEEEIERGTLCYLPIDDRGFVRPLGILYRKGRSLSVATQKLLDVLLEGAGKNAFVPSK
ncbi:MAG: LysR family transcriptional regulator, partial [Candidatus Latescibacteria bacterium]|nr:LysR family transcriptional regulator [Candidatus Latescibacterota bacterium]